MSEQIKVSLHCLGDASKSTTRISAQELFIISCSIAQKESIRRARQLVLSIACDGGQFYLASCCWGFCDNWPRPEFRSSHRYRHLQSDKELLLADHMLWRCEHLTRKKARRPKFVFNDVMMWHNIESATNPHSAVLKISKMQTGNTQPKQSSWHQSHRWRFRNHTTENNPRRR